MMVGLLNENKRHNKTITTRNISRRPVENVGVLYFIKSHKRQQVDGIRQELFNKYPTEYEMMEG